MFAGLPAHSSRVVHDNDRKEHGDRKDRGIPARRKACRDCNGSDRRGMTARHAAVSDKALPYYLLVDDEVKDRLDDLGAHPGDRACLYDPVPYDLCYDLAHEFIPRS